MSSIPLRPIFSKLSASLLALGLSFMVVNFCTAIPKGFSVAFADIFGVGAALLGCLFCIHRAFSNRSSIRALSVAWAFIGLANLSYAGGEFAWAVYELALGREAPSPGLADLGWLGFYPFLFAGLGILTAQARTMGKTRLWMDSAIITSVFALPAWVFLIERLWEQSEGSLTAKLIGVAYPLCDLTALMLVVALFRSREARSERNRSYAWLAVGVGCYVIGDFFYAIDTLRGVYETASWYAWSWPFGGLALGYAALCPAEPTKPIDSAKAPSLASIIYPYVFSTVMLVAVVIYDVAKGDGLSGAEVATGTLLFGMISLRQIITLVENRQLTRSLSELSEQLEQTIEKRTQMISAHNEYSKAVLGNIALNQVSSASCESMARLLGARGVALWIRTAGDSAGSEELAAYQGFDNCMPILMETNWPDEELPWAEVGISLAQPELREDGSNLLWVKVAIASSAQLIGRVGLLFAQNEWTPEKRTLLESFLVELAAGIHNARLYASALDAAERDPLTSIYNHRVFQLRLERTLSRCQEAATPVSVMIVDMANFKLFNKAYGHSVGDDILKHVSANLLALCGPQDVVARYRGDQFALLLPGLDHEDALEYAQHVRSTLQQAAYRRKEDDRIVEAPFTIAAATFPSDAADRFSLLALLDSNLVRAKQSVEQMYATSDDQRDFNEIRAGEEFSFLDAMVTAVDNKDRYTRRHSEDVTSYSLWIGEELGLSQDDLSLIREAGLLHDVGKIGVPDEILRKPGFLSDSEFVVMKRHPEIGALIVSSFPGMEAIIPCVRHHHERWDGLGYPDRLAEEQTPMLARLMAVADAFSAMTTDRPYRKGMDWVESLGRLVDGKGTHFDPAMVDAFLHAVERRKGISLDAIRPALPKAA